MSGIFFKKENAKFYLQEKFTWNVMANGTIFRGWRLAKTPSLNGKKLEIIVDDNVWIPCLSDPKQK